MQIDAENFVNIMERNFGLKKIETMLGKGVVMDPFSAFVYSSITGAGYLDDPFFQYTPKGLMKVFYSALNYKFVTGLFDKTTLKNTPVMISKAKKYLFEGEKIIVPVEFNYDYELQNRLSDSLPILDRPKTDFIIQRIEISKNGNGMEPFMEYIACEVFKQFDYMVETQIPLSAINGTPDFGAFKLQSILRSSIPLTKFNLLELAMIRLGDRRGVRIISDIDKIIVGEAKTSTKIMEGQLRKYLKTGFFNSAYEIHPSKTAPSNDDFGLLTIGEDYRINLIRPISGRDLSNEKIQTHYLNWLTNYVKYYLIANLTNDEFVDFYLERNKKRINGIEDVIRFVNNLSYDDILKKIEEVQ
jgi:hypothetical protein